LTKNLNIFYYLVIYHVIDVLAHYESLQDKLAQLRDARDALTSLRDEHAEKRRIEAEEKAKRKQIQMMQKLDVLRKQKQVGLIHKVIYCYDLGEFSFS